LRNSLQHCLSQALFKKWPTGQTDQRVVKAESGQLLVHILWLRQIIESADVGQRFADAILCRPNGLPLEIDLPTFALVEYVTAPASLGLQITPEVAKKTVRLQAGVELWIAPVAPTRKKEPNSA
jgi:hypothetical protein